jgi:hypothetical protein
MGLSQAPLPGRMNGFLRKFSGMAEFFHVILGFMVAPRTAFGHPELANA